MEKPMSLIRILNIVLLSILLIACGGGDGLEKESNTTGSQESDLEEQAYSVELDFED